MHKRDCILKMSCLIFAKYWLFFPFLTWASHFFFLTYFLKNYVLELEWISNDTIDILPILYLQLLSVFYIFFDPLRWLVNISYSVWLKAHKVNLFQRGYTFGFVFCNFYFSKTWKLPRYSTVLEPRNAHECPIFVVSKFSLNLTHSAVYYLRLGSRQTSDKAEEIE